MEQFDLGIEKENDSDEETSTLISDLIQRSRLYSTTKDYQDLLDFVCQLRNMAPFNAMLVQIQKPGLRFAASEFDWASKFERDIKEGARPLIILWPCGPVALVYDIDDTEGEKPLPKDVAAFFRAEGDISPESLMKMVSRLQSKRVFTEFHGLGGSQAGNIRLIKPAIEKGERQLYEVRLNSRHSPAVNFSTLAHELAHLFLGHLGKDPFLRIKPRTGLPYETKEIEAESTAYIVCTRFGIKPNSETYLADFLSGSIEGLNPDVYAICKAAGHIESALGIAPRMRFGQTTGLCDGGIILIGTM